MVRRTRGAIRSTGLARSETWVAGFARLAELRRLLPLVAAVLFLVALGLPVWRITLTAPQYMEPLVVELYAYPRLGGDYAEVQLLNHYVGFYYPDPVYADPNYEVHENAIAAPEWVLGPVAFVGAAAASALVALVPSGRTLERALTSLFAGTVAIFAAMGAIGQYRLHQAGHSLDPGAPVTGVDGFTPPIVGSYEVANISGSAGLGLGGYLAVTGVGLLAVAVSLRGSDATVRDLPALLRSIVARICGAVRRRNGHERGEVPSQRERGSPGRSGAYESGTPDATPSAESDSPGPKPGGDPP